MFFKTPCFLLLADQPVRGLLNLALGKGGDKRGRETICAFHLLKTPVV